MKTIKYVPEVCKGESPKMKGEVELALVKYSDKLKFFKSTGIKLSATGEVEKMDTSQSFDFIIKQSEFSKDYYLKVDLEDLATGEKYTCFDDLEYGDLGQLVIQDISLKLMNGFSLGN